MPEEPIVVPGSAPGARCPGGTVGELAVGIVRRDLAALLDHEPGARAGADPEELHDMRVATRRLRVALTVFSGALPGRAGRLGAELDWLGNVLGTVRDLDVQLGCVLRWQRDLPVADGAALAELAALLVAERSEARRQLLVALASDRYLALVHGLSMLVDPGRARPVPGGQVPALLAVPDRVDAAHRRVLRAAARARRRGSPRDFHRLRIRCKKLRYTVELVADLYPKTAPAAAARVARVQDRLGAVQDAVVLYDRLRAIAATSGPVLSPRALFVMGTLAERTRQQAGRRLRRLPDRLGGLDGSAWKRLRSDMRRLAPPPGPGGLRAVRRGERRRA